MPDLRSALQEALSTRHRVHRCPQRWTRVIPTPHSGSGITAGPTLSYGSYWKSSLLPSTFK